MDAEDNDPIGEHGNGDGEAGDGDHQAANVNHDHVYGFDQAIDPNDNPGLQALLEWLPELNQHHHEHFQQYGQHVHNPHVAHNGFDEHFEFPAGHAQAVPAGNLELYQADFEHNQEEDDDDQIEEDIDIDNAQQIVNVMLANENPEPMNIDDSDVSEDDSSIDSDSEDLSSSDGEEESRNKKKWARRIARLRYAIAVQKQRNQPKPVYAFRPFQLIRRNFKGPNVFSDFPSARSGHRIIADNSHLYCLGGYNPRNALVNARRGQCLLFQELWSYNFAINRWNLLLNVTNAAHMPIELASNALEMYNNKLITHGGTGYPFGESCSNACHIYTIGPRPIIFSLKVSGEMPTPQYGPGICIHDDYLYTIGGTTGFEYSCDVYRLNLRNNLWECMYTCRPEIREDPEGRYRHEVVCDGKYIFVLGGGTSQIVYDLERIPAYKLKTNRWEYFQTYPDRSVPQSSTATHNAGYPKPRKCFSCVAFTNDNGDVEAVITGGLQGDYTNYFSDIWRLNLRTKQWTLIRTAKLPKPLYFHSAAHTGNGCMYIFGGIEYTKKEMRRRNELYKMWIKIPQLSEMCWDALTYYNDQLNSYDPQSLVNYGIPQKFLDRIPRVRIGKHADGLQSQDAATVPKRLRSLFE